VIDGNFAWTKFAFSPIGSRTPLLFLNPRDIATARMAGWKLRDLRGLLRQPSGAHEKRVVFPPGWFSRYPRPFMSILGRMADRWLKSAGTSTSRVVVLSYPHYLPTLDRLPGVKSVYYWSDDFSSYWGPSVIDLEDRAVAATSLTITASLSKRDELRSRHPGFKDRIHAVIHGHHPAVRAQAAGAEPGPLPDELKNLKRPILGHWGNISRHLDLSLALATAKAFPSASLVFIGPAYGALSEPDESALSKLRSLPNVYFISAKPYALIGDYVPAFDVCLCLYRPDIYFCQVINPSKVRDYLASGRPIVSTPIPEVCKLWAPFVHIGSAADSYVAAVTKALEDRNFQARLDHADDNSYEVVSHRIESLLVGDTGGLELAVDHVRSARAGSAIGAARS
jgi:hypothetical protein